MRAPLYPRGTRVQLRRGAFPMDPGLIGRTGLVVRAGDQSPKDYGVQLDEEERVRDFHESELEGVESD